MDRSRILVVDDHPTVRYAVSVLLAEEPQLEVCGEASNRHEALEKVRSLKPDLVLIDMARDGFGGVELIKKIRDESGRIKILMTSQDNKLLQVERSLRAGAHGYVDKHETPEMFVSAIQEVLQGRIYLSARMSQHLFRRMTGRDTNPQFSPLYEFSDRELELFELVGQGMTDEEIAEGLDLSLASVSALHDGIRRKLNLDSRQDLARQAFRWLIQCIQTESG